MRGKLRATAMLVASVALVSTSITVGASPAAAKSPRHHRQWDPGVERIAKVVEDIRGLRFDHPVKVQFQTEPETETGLVSTPVSDEDLEDDPYFVTQRVQQSLGLIGDDVDLAALAGTSPGLPLGYYDGSEIVIKGRRLNAMTEIVLAHELTHALEDQHHLDALSSELEDEEWNELRASVGQALTEGSASLVADQYLARQSTEVQDRFRRFLDQEAEAVSREVPEIIRSLITERYDYGELLVRAIKTRGGPALDRALTAPPSDDLPLLHPGDPEPSPISAVPLPRLEAGEQHREEFGRLGALGLYHLLASRIDPLVALHAADLWGGDRSITFRRGAQDCVRITMVGRDPAGTTTIAEALTAWARAFGPATTTVDAQGVNVTACAGTPHPPVPSPDQAIRTADLIALTRNELEVRGLEAKWSQTDTECVVRTYLDEALIQAFADAAAQGTVDSPSLNSLLAARRETATTSCGVDVSVHG